MPPRVQPELECSTCTAITRNGNQCRNTTCKSKFCWIHLKYQKGLRIKPSGSGHGDGLFTADTDAGAIQRDTRIGIYSGERLPIARLNELYPDPDNPPMYTVCPTGRSKPDHICVDARKTNSNAVRYANTSRGVEGASDNAKIVYYHGPRGEPETVSLKTKGRPIARNTEIFATYGNAYRIIQ